MKHASILTFAFSLLFASAASAGGIIIYYKEADQTAVVRPAPDSAASIVQQDDQGPSVLGQLPGPKGFGRKVLAVEQADAELDVADLEAVGCGGASAAAGPAGLLPLLLSGFALLRRRR